LLLFFISCSGSFGGFRQRLADWASGLVGRDHNASLDVYPYIFFCDFVNYVIVVFFYWSFGPTAGNVTSYLRDNRIPWPFLIQLLLQFVLIVVDRALYLRRNAFGKFVFQVGTDDSLRSLAPEGALLHVFLLSRLLLLAEACWPTCGTFALAETDLCRPKV